MVAIRKIQIFCNTEIAINPLRYLGNAFVYVNILEPALHVKGAWFKLKWRHTYQPGSILAHFAYTGNILLVNA